MESERMTTREHIYAGLVVSTIIGLGIYGIHEHDKKTIIADFTSEVDSLSACLSRRAADILQGGNEIKPTLQHANMEYQISYCDREEANKPDSRHGWHGSRMANVGMQNCLQDRVGDIHEANARSSGVKDVKDIIQYCATHVQENFDSSRLDHKETVSVPEGTFGK
ncbi:MAG: hypothetical protein NTX63_02700 [Candidatus Peregrinibacteria bacterium]|nr:hypothetical protein [Candidatus Peregrinibacteria bacterium]